MAVVAMSDIGKARKGKRKLGRFYLPWEDLCGGFLLFWVGVFCNYYLFSLKVRPRRMKTSPK